MQRLPPRRRRGRKAPIKSSLRRPVIVVFLFCLAALFSVFLFRRKACAQPSIQEQRAPPPPPPPPSPPLSPQPLPLPLPPKVERACWVFQHLHKSGGMTIRRIMNPPKGDLEADGDIAGYGTDEWRLGRAFSEETLAPQIVDEKRYRIATGGYTGALRLNPRLSKACGFFTVFRHPVNRLVSAYYWCRSPKHSWDPLCASSVMDASKVGLVDFAAHWGNYAARQMAMSFIPADDVVQYVNEAVGDARPAMLNGVPVEDIPSWFLLKLYLRHRHRGSGDDGGDGSGKAEGHYTADHDAFNDDAALSDLMGPIHVLLRDNFTAVGVVEDFDASMKLFDDVGVVPGKSWAATYAKLGAANKNEASETEGGEVLRQALVSSEIKKYLRLDILLYDHAVAVFHNMVHQHSHSS
eukprot:g10531.t1